MPFLPSTHTLLFEQYMYNQPYLSQRLIIKGSVVMDQTSAGADGATIRVENDYFGFSFSKQKNELHLFVAKFALVLDKCLV